MTEEGSVIVDQGGVPTTANNEGSDESLEVRDDSNQGEGGESQTNQGEQGGEGEKPKYTEKGTKLDPNPQSAVHQQLANARATLRQYQQVLTNPEALRRYAKEAGMTLAEAKEEIKEEQKALYSPDKLKTVGDFTNALNEMHTNFQKELKALRDENEGLKRGFTGFSQGQRLQRITTNMQNDIATVQGKYPELNPKSSEYDPALENEIGALYNELDAVDPSDPSQGYRGKVSLAKLTDRIMKAAGRSQKKATERAQTDVRVKQAGKVVTSTKSGKSSTESSKDPGTVIAQRIAKALKQ